MPNPLRWVREYMRNNDPPPWLYPVAIVVPAVLVSLAVRWATPEPQSITPPSVIYVQLLPAK